MGPRSLVGQQLLRHLASQASRADKNFEDDMAAARQVSRQPYGLRRAEAELAHNLVARSKQFADADRIVPHRVVVR